MQYVLRHTVEESGAMDYEEFCQKYNAGCLGQSLGRECARRKGEKISPWYQCPFFRCEKKNHLA
jgi:hypothetical protein